MPEDVLELGTEIDAGGEIGDQNPEATESIEQSGGGDHGQTPGEQIAEAKLFVDGKFGPEVSAHLNELKASNPRMANLIGRSLRELNGYRQQFPNGLKDYREQQTRFQQIEQEFGDADQLRDTMTELDALRDIDTLFTAGDPKLIEEMAEASPDAFLQLMPAALAKYSQLNPEGFGGFVARTILDHMRQSDFMLNMARLQDHLEGNPKALQALDQVYRYIGALGEMAKNKAVPERKQPDARGTELDAREQKIREQETNGQRREWSNWTSGERRKTFDAEYARQTAGMKITDVQKSGILELFNSRMLRALKAENPTLEKFFASGQRDAYQRHIKGALDREIPKALKAAIDTIAPGRKPGPMPAANPGTGKPASKPAPGASGIKTLGQRPGIGNAPNQIDQNRTSSLDYMNGKGVLNDGTRVQWSTARK